MRLILSLIHTQGGIPGRYTPYTHREAYQGSTPLYTHPGRHMEEVYLYYTHPGRHIGRYTRVYTHQGGI